MTDYYGNQPPSNPYPYQQQPDPYQQQQDPYQQQNPYQQSNPYQQQNPYQPNPPSNPFPAPTYPQSPPTGVPAQNLPAVIPSSSFPASGSFPSYYQPTPEPQQPKSRAKVILIVAALVMFVTAGVFTSLYLTANSDHDKAVSTLEERKTELADVKKDITSAEEAKSNAEKTNGDLKTQNDALQPCVDATMFFLWDATEAELEGAVNKMRDVCK
jgi:hypothetical protein